MKRKVSAAKKLIIVKTAKEVVAVLGGVDAVCRMAGKDVKTVYHWTGDAGFPARTHDWMTKALKKRGVRAPPVLWNQTQEIKAA